MDNAHNESVPKRPRGFHRHVIIFFVLALAALLFLFGFELGKEQTPESAEFISLDDAVILNEEERDRSIDFALFWRVWELVSEKYVDRDQVNARDLLYGAIGGMMRATGDPYTVFLTPEQNAALTEELDGQFEGIGAEIDQRDGVLTIIAPLEGSPAQASGLQPGDRIIAIDGNTTADLIIEEAVTKIRGPKGSEVVLTIFRDGESETREISIVRDVIVLNSVQTEFSDDNIAHIRISRFGEDTLREFRDALSQAKKNNAAGMIFDVRNNPGGLLDSVVDMASLVLPRNTVVVIEENSAGEQKKVFTQPATGTNTDTPIIILINQGSASASEILAGALRDNRDDVTIVGEDSFGKGSVQELIPLPENTAAKITVAKWLTPNGDQINEKGIAPDVVVELTQEDFDAERDPQLDRAFEILRNQN